MQDPLTWKEGEGEVINKENYKGEGGFKKTIEIAGR